MTHDPARAGPVPLWERLLSWAGILFCFGLFPGVLVLIALDHVLEAQANRQRTEAFQRLGDILDRLEPYQRDEFYLHAVLQRLYERAQRSRDPLASLARSIGHLRRRAPRRWKFVVWDGAGRLHQPLTDIKGYRAALERIWRGLRAVAADAEAGRRRDPGTLPEVNETLKLMRSVLGGFLVPGHLEFPYLPAPHGSVILSRFQEDRSHFWYQVGKRVGFLVILPWSILQHHIGLRRATPCLNRRLARGFGVGYANLQHQIEAGSLPPKPSPGRSPRGGVEAGRLPPKHSPGRSPWGGGTIRFPRGFPWRREVELALGRFDQSAEPFQESEHLLVAIRPFGSGLHGFAAARKDRVLPDRNRARRRAMILLAVFFLPVAGFSWLTLVRGGELFLSIRWQLGLLFLYANGLPLLVLAFLGWDFLQNRRIELFGQVQGKAEQAMMQLDRRFPLILEHYSGELEASLKALTPAHLTGPAGRSALSGLGKRLVELSSSEFFLVASDGRLLLSHADVLGGQRHSAKHMVLMGQDFLRFFNGRIIHPDKELWTSKEHGFQADASNLLDAGMSYLGRVHQEIFGTKPKWSYWGVLENPRDRTSEYILFTFWENQRLQELFLARYLPEANRNRHHLALLARFGDGRWVDPAGLAGTADLERLVRKAMERGAARLLITQPDGNGYLAVGWKGREISEVCLTALYPLSLVEAEVAGLRNRLLLFGLFSLALSVAIGQLVARQFLTPVAWFAVAARNIDRRQFGFRIPDLERDELGRLAGMLNRTLGSLEELDLGRVVQESLLPPGPFRQGRFSMFGRSVTMTELGGDYFDLFAVDERRCGVIVGDVAGHGVPAALMMAFAKAAVFLAGERKAVPGDLLAFLHDLFLRNKRKSMQRVMTMQYLVLDTVSGQATLSNAGHCYPLLVRGATGAALYLEMQGFPLGSVRRATFRTQDLTLEPGDLLVLYSDGFVEAKNAAGTTFGFPKWLQTVQACRQGSPEAVHDRIRAEHRVWSSEAGDDLTLVVICAGARTPAGEPA